ncbi:PAS domain S-box protein, partial [Mesorhizobium sp. M2A.F.Ca.ET.040.01.1.1]
MADDNKRNGKFWAQALDRAHLGLWDWNLSAGDCYYSPTWSKMLGYEPGELANTPDLWLKLTHPDDRQRAQESGDRHIAGLVDSIETELRLRHKNGHWVWVLDRGGIVERDADGKPLRLMGVQTDITCQKEAEAALEQVNVRFRLALAASGTGIWHHDIGTRKTFWDARTRE